MWDSYLFAFYCLSWEFPVEAKRQKWKTHNEISYDKEDIKSVKKFAQPEKCVSR